MCVFQGVCGDYTHRVSESFSCNNFFILCCAILSKNTLNLYVSTSILYVILLCFSNLSLFYNPKEGINRSNYLSAKSNEKRAKIDKLV